MRYNRQLPGLLGGVAMAGALATAGAAAADDDLTWSHASASVGTCVVGVTCGKPHGRNVLAYEAFTAADVDYNNASIHRDDYQPGVTNDYGIAWASAEAGEGTLALPVLKAYALGGGTGFGVTPNPTIAVNFAMAQAVQGYTNTGDTALLIPLNAFTGLVDYEMFGPPMGPGTVTAGLAITTSEILDPAVAALWSATAPGGQFTAGCGTAGALAIGAPPPRTSTPTGSTQYLPVTTSSCTGEDTYRLEAGETFYVWARLFALRPSFGVTDVSHTFNVTITPEAATDVAALTPSLAQATGANLDIAVAGVPEPGAWALMILGFGSAGAMLRRRRAVLA